MARILASRFNRLASNCDLFTTEKIPLTYLLVRLNDIRGDHDAGCELFVLGLLEGVEVSNNHLPGVEVILAVNRHCETAKADRYHGEFTLVFTYKVTFDKIDVGIPLFNQYHVEEGDGVSTLHINLAEDLCWKEAACPACVDLGNDKAAVLPNEEINTTVASLVSHVTMVSRILAHMKQCFGLFFSNRDRVPY